MKNYWAEKKMEEGGEGEEDQRRRQEGETGEGRREGAR
jgi:hypothetical protein